MSVLLVAVAVELVLLDHKDHRDHRVKLDHRDHKET
jgi:hypothetical protein